MEIAADIFFHMLIAHKSEADYQKKNKKSLESFCHPKKQK